MYLPTAFQVQDQEIIQQFIRDYPLATLICGANPKLEIAHLPLALDVANNCLFGHIARNNPLLQYIQQSAPATLIFHGPQGYVSANDYPDPQNNVPTWNYAVVHVQGTFHPLAAAELPALLDKLSQQNEPQLVTEWNNPAVFGKLGGIVGFRISIREIIAKFKLSQNRTPLERQTILNNLSNSSIGNIQELAEFMRKTT